MTNMSNLDIHNITKSYNGKQVLNNVSLSLPQSTVALLGPNGAGKTTLLRILATVIEPDSGEILWDTYRWQDRKAIRPLIGYLPQHFNFYPYLTVRECLEYIAILKSSRKISLQDRVSKVIEKTNLSAVSDKRIHQLSGGMLRRVGIAQALIATPQILLIDEPTAGLDPEECIRFRNCILSESAGKTTIISTHITQDAETMCQYVAVLIRGNICFFGSTSDFIHSADGYVMDESVSIIRAEEIRKSFCVIQEQNSVNHEIRVRYLMTETHKQSATPTLADAYFLLMQREDIAK